MLRDPLLNHLVTDFADEAAAGNPSGPLYADSSAYMIVANLLRLAGQVTTPSDPGARALDTKTLARIIEVMEDRLGEQVPMAELAQLAGMNVYRFSRAFRAATGDSPHRHLTQRRIDRVCQMLDNTSEPLAHVAHDCGFSSQSHMTAAFTKAMGVPPGHWRRKRRA